MAKTTGLISSLFNAASSQVTYPLFTDWYVIEVCDLMSEHFLFYMMVELIIEMIFALLLCNGLKIDEYKAY